MNFRRFDNKRPDFERLEEIFAVLAKYEFIEILKKLALKTKIVDYTFVPGRDIIETDDEIIVNIALPGIKKEDIALDSIRKIS